VRALLLASDAKIGISTIDYDPRATRHRPKIGFRCPVLTSPWLENVQTKRVLAVRVYIYIYICNTIVAYYLDRTAAVVVVYYNVVNMLQ